MNMRNWSNWKDPKGNIPNILKKTGKAKEKRLKIAKIKIEAPSSTLRAKTVKKFVKTKQNRNDFSYKVLCQRLWQRRIRNKRKQEQQENKILCDPRERGHEMRRFVLPCDRGARGRVKWMCKRGQL
eukprot:GFUD01002699.1.p1 GENE.GFUD01002699.1~~GFUD01002699.1.p1  ORF type:complete len:126 (-),score=26.09 GFUD01002699.1:67-444(-)